MATPTTGLASLVPSERSKGMTHLTAYLSGAGSPEPDFYSEDTDLTFPQLQANADKVDEQSVDGNGDTSTGKRMMACYTQAVLRDAQYGVAGRVQLMGLGYHNKFRILYEGMKIHIDVRGMA